MNRRDFLKTMGAGTGAALVGSDVIRALAAPDLPLPLRAPANADTMDPVYHVLNRVTFGPRPGQVDAVKKMGLQAYLDQQLNPSAIDDSDSENRLGDYITLDLSVSELQALGAAQAEIIAELDTATVFRAVYSQRQLFEVMVNFWSEHFSIWHHKGTCSFLKTADDRDVVRKYALGKFRDLLGASAQSPAMLIYLDNAESNKTHPNENYAREVMELHTVTIGNYTEDDVKEVARCFTGWAIQGPNGDTPGAFAFNPKLHDDGPKLVMGHAIPAGGGIKDGQMVLDMLASHPATAQHIASKLCRRFIADNPPDTVVKAATDTFTKTNGDISSVLRTIFASPEFLNAAPKFKRPFEYLISLYRAFDAQIDAGKPGQQVNLAPLGLLLQMGHLPFNHVTPDGYTDFASLWIDNMLLRWNAAILTVYNVTPHVKIDLAKLITDQGVQPAARPIIDYFANHLLGRSLTQTELDTIWNFVSKSGAPDLTKPGGRQRLADAIAMIAASPAFQYR